MNFGQDKAPVVLCSACEPAHCRERALLQMLWPALGGLGSQACWDSMAW